MNKAVYEEKRKFVNALNQPLSALSDFEAIEYAHDNIRGDEYIRIRDKIGQAFYTNVTGCSNAEILAEVARAILEKRMLGFVTDRERKREISPLFRKVV